MGAGTLRALLQGVPSYDVTLRGLGQNYYGDSSPDRINVGTCFVAEIIMTSFFILVVLGATSKKTGHTEQAMAGLVIGLSLTCVIIGGIPITGASVNPARSLGASSPSSSSLFCFVWGCRPMA